MTKMRATAGILSLLVLAGCERPSMTAVPTVPTPVRQNPECEKQVRVHNLFMHSLDSNRKFIENTKKDAAEANKAGDTAKGRQLTAQASAASARQLEGLKLQRRGLALLDATGCKIEFDRATGELRLLD